MTPDDELRQHLVLNRVNRVFHHTKDVKTRQDRLGKFDVLRKRNCGIVTASCGVGRCDDSTSCLQGRHYTGLGDRNRLLFHGFVNASSVRIVHLVEFVYEACPLVGKHKSSTFESPFACNRIFPDAGRKTNGTGTLTRGEDCTMCCLLNILEKLRLRSTRVTEQ